MRLSIQNIRHLFFDPRTQSLKKYLSLIISSQKKIASHTTPRNAIHTFRYRKPSDYHVEIHNAHIPQRPLHSRQLPALVANLYRGMPKWHSERTMYNVAPPPLITTVAAKFLSALHNPNLVIDTASGEALFTEKKVIKMIAEYVGWDWRKASGTFTFGGKATTIYGIRLGLAKALPHYHSSGITEPVLIFSTQAGHPSHISDCEWLGLGRDAVRRIPVSANGQINLLDLEAAFDAAFSAGLKVPAIILTGGATNNMTVDPIAAVRRIRDQMVVKYSLSYVPHIHVDAVVGFPWIFFKDYDFTRNPNELSPKVAEKIRTITRYIVELKDADSFGIDFHKLGFCPYISSALMVRHGADLTGNDPDHTFRFGENYPYKYTIENTRSADGPFSAYLALKTLGVEGFQVLLGHLVSVATDLSLRLERTGLFETHNANSLGSSIIFTPIVTDRNHHAQDAYTAKFFDLITRGGHSYYIDRIPAFSTGAASVPVVALKVYVMSPYASTMSNEHFVSHLVALKKQADIEFDSSNISHAEFSHPLK